VPGKRGLKACPRRDLCERQTHNRCDYGKKTWRIIWEGNIIAYHDDYPLYNCLNGICPHFAINHSNGQYADEDICTNNAENRFSLLRPFLQKYGGVSKYNL